MTQGDLLSMFMYTIGTLPLIHSLSDSSSWTQICYAYTASTGGSLEDIHKGFSLLCSWDPAFGYFPEPSQSFVVICKHCRAKAEDLCQDLGVQVVTGNRYLGSFIGDLHDRMCFKVNKWVNYVHTFSDIALIPPQLGYTAVIRSLQHEWTFLLWVLPDCGLQF